MLLLLLLATGWAVDARVPTDYSSYSPTYRERTKPVLADAIARVRAVVNSTKLPEQIVYDDMANKLEQRISVHVKQEAEAMQTTLTTASTLIGHFHHVRVHLLSLGENLSSQGIEILSQLEDFGTTIKWKQIDGTGFTPREIVNLVNRWIKENPDKLKPDSWTVKYVTFLVGMGKAEAAGGNALDAIVDPGLRKKLREFLTKRVGKEFGAINVPESVTINGDEDKSIKAKDIFEKLQKAADLTQLHQLTSAMAKAALDQIQSDVSLAATQLTLAVRQYEDKLGGLYQPILAKINNLAFGLELVNSSTV